MNLSNKQKTSHVLVDKRGFFSGTPDGIRTHDLQSRSLTLYPAELRAHLCSNIIANPAARVKL